MLGRIAGLSVKGAAGLALALMVAAPVKAETLAEALVATYNNSGLIEQNRAVLRAADEDVALAASALRPILTWSASAQRSFGTTGSISQSSGAYGISRTSSDTVALSLVAQQTLYAGGSNRLRVLSAKETVLATRQALVSVEQQVLLRGVEAFMEVRRANENVRLSQNNVRVIGEELRAARDRFEVGEVTRTDVALAEARLAAARSSLAASEGSLAVAREEYRAVTGNLPGSLSAPRGLPGLPGSIDSARDVALKGHPALLQTQHQVSAAELGIQIAQASLKPTVALEGRVTKTDDLNARGFSNTGSLGITASGPIYRGGSVASQVRKARATRDQARASLLDTTYAISQAVGQAYAQLRVAQASQTSFEAQVRAAQVAFDGVREEATLGARTTLEVLDAEQELLSARSNLISAQVDTTIAAYTVLSTLGRLTAEDLNLPVPGFDPEAYYKLVENAPSAISQQGRELNRVLEALGKQ